MALWFLKIETKILENGIYNPSVFLRNLILKMSEMVNKILIDITVYPPPP